MGNLAYDIVLSLVAVAVLADDIANWLMAHPVVAYPIALLFVMAVIWRFSDPKDMNGYG